MSHQLDFSSVGSNITGVLNDNDAINGLNIASFGSLGATEINSLLELAGQTDHLSLLDDDIVISAPEASDLPMPDNLFTNESEKQNDVMDVWAKLLNEENSPNIETKSENELEMETFGLCNEDFPRFNVENKGIKNFPTENDVIKPVKIADNQNFNPNKSNIIHPIPLRMPPDDILKQFPSIVPSHINLGAMHQQRYGNVMPQTEEQRATTMLLNDLFKGSNGIPPSMMGSQNYQPGKISLNDLVQQPPPPFYNHSYVVNNPNQYSGLVFQCGQPQKYGREIPMNSVPVNSARGKTESVISEESTSKKHSKQNTFPSKRTIHDFALDPFAGLMSQKEREWLIKIQLVQSTISGDPNEDDYYYVNWKKRHNIVQRPKHLKKVEKVKPSYYSFENITPSTGYCTPSFEGALGKINSATSIAPKQHICLSQHLDNESMFSEKPTKRVKTILMTIENCYSSILIVDQNNRIIREGKENDSRINELLEDNSVRIKKIKSMLFEGDFAVKCLLINKARQFLSLFLSYLKESKDISQYINILLDGYTKYHKRVNDNLVIPIFIPKLKLGLFSIPESVLTGFFLQINLDIAKANVSSEFITLLNFNLLNRLCAVDDILMVKRIAASGFSWLFNLENYTKLPQIQNCSNYISYLDIDNIKKGFTNGLFGSQNNGIFENSIFSKVQFN
ncbi:Topoisomerase II-associated protein PAT1 family-containing protein [Strongyloides ratti]|uniref:Topoisomerase II-associated protein PAT1 family-containing protein n=1 Tax=Strongyloides ratti TaxID=34506 RepID=A0A090L365_STRRB|nr:Topoisomerase II-associated protein PAT1 family-containing protein [Strongyloides ratti]CEF64216.1 Topoisomerase II-associated protein PAT1 family-containing protein [Strongyloides ratti]